jgi:hypothetical protein
MFQVRPDFQLRPIFSFGPILSFGPIFSFGPDFSSGAARLQLRRGPDCSPGALISVPAFPILHVAPAKAPFNTKIAASDADVVRRRDLHDFVVLHV